MRKFEFFNKIYRFLPFGQRSLSALCDRTRVQLLDGSRATRRGPPRLMFDCREPTGNHALVLANPKLPATDQQAVFDVRRAAARRKPSIAS